MKVNMSPESVHARLIQMGQLWELSVALSNSRSIDGPGLKRNRRGVAVIEDSIRKILMDEWDPVGVRGVPGAADEYDGYIGQVYRIVSGGGTADEIAGCLERIEREVMAVCTSADTRTRVAEQLTGLYADMNRIGIIGM
jgi:hypothetical protein